MKSCLLYNARNIARQHRRAPAQNSSQKKFSGIFGGFVNYFLSAE
jgi:hypothetical protein